MDLEVLSINKHKIGTAFENWVLEKQDKSGFLTLPLPKWNHELGFWSNTLQLLQEVQKVQQKTLEIQEKVASEVLTTSAIKKRD